MPTTVPGTAKFSIAMNSKARLPAKRWRSSRYATANPNAAVRGAAVNAIISVVENELQAPPVQKSLPFSTAMPNAVA